MGSHLMLGVRTASLVAPPVTSGLGCPPHEGRRCAFVWEEGGSWRFVCVQCVSEVHVCEVRLAWGEGGSMSMLW